MYHNFADTAMPLTLTDQESWAQTEGVQKL